jgi:DNA-binding NarL/FixJ family response regulator
MIRVAVGDDHPVFREGTAALLAQEADIEVSALGANLDDAAAILGSPDPPDVLLLDVRLGDESGLRLLDRADRRCAVVVFTAYDYPQYVQAALTLGAAGFVAKSAPTEELLAAVRHAAAGGLAFSRRPSTSTPTLTEREAEVVRLVADGKSNDEIGRVLDVSSKTVESHIGRIFARTGIQSRTELASRAIREGWLEVPGDPVSG